MKGIKFSSYIQKKTKNILVLLLTVSILTSCGTVPIMGRKQVLLVSDSEILTLSFKQYNDYIRTARVDNHSPNARMVQKVGRKISIAVEEFMRQNGLSSEIGKLRWEFNYVRDNSINAFCMPGGKIVVFEGIMRVIDNENDLAVVLSHEIAHAVAKHSNERMSQTILVNMGNAAVNAVLSDKSETTQMIGNTVFGLGAQLGIMLPYSRKHEYEADELGLYFMAMAGYNPQKADQFWIKMASLSKNKPPEIMSSHPSDENRIKRIRESVPKVIKYTEKGNRGVGRR